MEAMGGMRGRGRKQGLNNEHKQTNIKLSLIEKSCRKYLRLIG